MASRLQSGPPQPPPPPGSTSAGPQGQGGGGGGGKNAFDKLLAGLNKFSNQLEKTGRLFDKAANSIIKTQKDFGLNIADAAKLQSDALMATVDDYTSVFKTINWSAIAEGFKIAGGGLLDVFTGGGAEAAKNAVEQLNKEISGGSLELPVTFSERMAATKEVQNEFGVINRELAESVAKTAKTYGLSVKDLVQSRRIFATIARGDLTQVDRLQGKFVDQFERQGMSRRVALEAITKNAELIARNGTRFADAFARAAADAKKIGIDLGKIDQIGDNIIDDFEGFLEGQAELGAMGFNFDSQRLQQIAETGSTADLYFELRSQLSAQNIDINNLRRSQRLAIEKGLLQGMSISELQRMAGENPQLGADEPEKPTNTILGEIMKLFMVGGPFLAALAPMLKAIPTAFDAGLSALKLAIDGLTKLIGAVSLPGTVIGLLAIIAGYGAYKGGAAVEEQIKRLMDEGNSLIDRGFFEEGAKKIQEAFTAKSNAERVNFDGAYDDLSGYNSKRQLDAMDAADRVIKEKINESILKRGTGPRVSPLPDNSKLLPQLTVPSGFGIPEMNPNQPATTNPFQPTIKKASGGIIRGPGTEKSDSIPARLSNGEFVIKANTVKKLGVDTLNAINSGIDLGQLSAAALQRGKNLSGGKLDHGITHLFDYIASRGGKDFKPYKNWLLSGRDQFIPKITEKGGMKTAIGQISNFAPRQLKAVGQTLKTAPIIGNALSGTFEGYKEYTQTGDWKRALAKALVSTGGGILGAAAGTGATLNPVGGVVGGIAGSNLAESLFDKYYGFKDGGLVGRVKSTVMNKGMNFLSNRIPGFGMGMGLLQDYRQGGIGGALKSAMSGGLGKMIGGALGSAIPIPGVGTAIGSLMGSKIGKLVGGLFGRKKQPVAQQIMGALPEMGGFAGKLMGRIPGMERFDTEGLFRNMVAQPQAQAAVQAVVDTTGIEQKLNNFIAALNNIQINMDGAKVGKVLVNASDAAMSIGVFKSQARATL